MGSSEIPLTIQLREKSGIQFFEDIVSWIGDNLDPDEVFDEQTLRDWAEANGFVLEES